ncbi:MAG: PGF-CTERM protein [Natronomonas sp.]|jgi:PGF-CTERM protein
MSVTTNAQRFSTPSVVNQSLRVWVAAPTKTVAGNDHNGFYQAEIPDSQLSEWGVDDPKSELSALYKGDATNFTVTETDSGARIRLDNISYSAGFAEVKANPSESTSDTTTTTATTPERTVATVTEDSSGAASVTVDNVELRDPVVAPLDGVGTDAMTVEEVTATFDMGTNVDNEIRVRATDEPPATVPAVTGDARSYLTVEVEGNLADRVSRGTFSFSLDADVAPSDPGAVTVYRYHDGGWQRVTTRHLGGTRFEAVAPGYSTFAVVVADRQSTPDRTATPTPEPVTTTEPPTTAEPVSTAEPPTTSKPEAATAARTTPTSGPTTTAPTAADREGTPTAGAGSPGFGVVAVLAALLAVLALARRD